MRQITRQNLRHTSHLLIFVRITLVSCFVSWSNDLLTKTTGGATKRNETKGKERKGKERRGRRERISLATCTAAWLTVREARVNVRRRMLFNFAFITRKTRTLLLAIASGVAGSLKRSRSLVRISLSPRLRALPCSPPVFVRPHRTYVFQISHTRCLARLEPPCYKGL